MEYRGKTMAKENLRKVNMIEIDERKRTKKMLNIYNEHSKILNSKVNGKFIFNEPVIFSDQEIEMVRKIRRQNEG